MPCKLSRPSRNFSLLSRRAADAQYEIILAQQTAPARSLESFTSTMAPRTRVKGDAHQQVDEPRPTVADLQGDSAFAQLAQKYWLKPSKKTTKVKVKPDVLKNEIWDVLEQEGFTFKSLLALENLQILEKYDSNSTLEAVTN